MSNQGANMDFSETENQQNDENQQPSSMGTINYSNIPLISELGILLQGAQSCSGFCHTTDVGHQAVNYSDVLNVLSSFGHASPISAQKADEIPCSETILHGGEKGESSGTRRKYTGDSMEIQQSRSDEDTPVEDSKTSGECKPLKRRRSAVIHNLTERIRRQRLKEKMKALQELIPNCSKRDKASTLDDAISYIKTLQYQVQMISMGAGFTMFRAPWMVPAQQGMQQIPGLSSLLHAGPRDGYGIEMEMSGPPSVHFLTNQLGLPISQCSLPFVSSGFLAQSLQNPGNVMEPLLFTTSSTNPSLGSPCTTQWETSRS